MGMNMPNVIHVVTLRAVQVYSEVQITLNNDWD